MPKDKSTILIVDADLTLASKLTDMLYSMGSVGVVLHAYTYSEAVHVLKHRNVSVLVVSITLPGRNGIELLRTLRDADYKAHVVMMSKYPNNYYRALCTSLGASYFFDKADDLNKLPFIVSELQLDSATNSN
jgi:DNA-binding NarL/FixJ family response regulator